jgi:DNA-binding CsgD family transcriptional regulator
MRTIIDAMYDRWPADGEIEQLSQLEVHNFLDDVGAANFVAALWGSRSWGGWPISSALTNVVKNMLQTIDGREAAIIQLRFGIGFARPRTLEEIGGLYGISKPRVRQLEGQALRKLRHPRRVNVLREFSDWLDRMENAASFNEPAAKIGG